MSEEKEYNKKEGEKNKDKLCTVKELINYLKELNQDALICILENEDMDEEDGTFSLKQIEKVIEQITVEHPFGNSSKTMTVNIKLYNKYY